MAESELDCPIIQVHVENTHILEIILMPTPKDQSESMPDLDQPFRLFPPRCTACTVQRLKFIPWRDGTESSVVMH